MNIRRRVGLSPAISASAVILSFVAKGLLNVAGVETRRTWRGSPDIGKLSRKKRGKFGPWSKGAK